MTKYKGYKIEKKNRVMRMKSEGFEPTTFEVWKVTGPRGFKKYFTTQKDAKAFIKGYTDKTMTVEVVTNLLNEIKYK